jgi:hypothetical protein
MIRVNIFKNTDYMRQNGQVVMFNHSQFDSNSWFRFLQACAVKLTLYSSINDLHVYTPQGGRVTRIEEICHDDVLFVSTNREPFNYQIVVVGKGNEDEKQENKNGICYTIHVNYNCDNCTRQLTYCTNNADNCSIGDLKSWLSKQTGLCMNDIILMYKNNVSTMEDNLKLSQCFLKQDALVTDSNGRHYHCSSFHFSVVLMLKPLTLFVKQMGIHTHRTLQLSAVTDSISRSMLVSELKSIIARKSDGVIQFKLMYDQKTLIDGERLESYGIQSESLLYMF